MIPSLAFAPRKLAHFLQPVRCLRQVRKTTYLSKEELARALDDQIRARYPRSLQAEVEAVVEARRGIWGGVNGGVYVAPQFGSIVVQTDLLKQNESRQTSKK